MIAYLPSYLLTESWHSLSFIQYVTYMKALYLCDHVYEIIS